MKTIKRSALKTFLLAFPILAWSALCYADSSTAPWIGVWTLTADQSLDAAKASNSQATVEIKPGMDGKGLEISRKTADQSIVKELLILDGSRKPLDAKDCSGWQSSKWIPEAGAIIGASEVNCKDSASFSTSSMKLILAPDQMVDILGIKTGQQIRIATRRLKFDHELSASSGSRSEVEGIASRSAASAPWPLECIFALSKLTDEQVLQAALVEKNVQVAISAKSLKQMKAGNLSKSTIDLLVALAFPNKYHIETNGDVKLQALSRSSSASGISYLPAPAYFPGYYAHLSDLYFYYGSPFWWDNYFAYYPRRYYGGGGSYYGGGSSGSGGSGGAPTSSHGQMTNQGYVNVTPIDAGRHTAQPGGGMTPRGFSFGSSANTAPGYSGSSGSASPAPAASSGSTAVAVPASSSGSSSSSGGSAAPQAAVMMAAAMRSLDRTLSGN